MSARSATRRLFVALALATAVGAPTIACMGGGSADTEKGKSWTAAKAMIGTWRILPTDEELRELTIISMAIKGNKKGFDKLKPPATAEEKAIYTEIRAKAEAGDPEIIAVGEMIDHMKTAKVEITDSNYIQSVGSDTNTYSYTVDSKTKKQVKLTLKGGGAPEKHTLNFEGKDKIRVKVTAPYQLNMTFKRK